METPTYSAEYPSPLGLLRVTATDRGVSRISFFEDENGAESQLANLHVNQCLQELDEYFGGNRQSFSISLAPAGTPFEESVWQALLGVPYGDTCSYLDIANRIQNPKAIRAVGRANGANPIAIIIPCHRVIGSDGSLTGYGGELWRKRWLLDHEARVAGTQLF